MNISTTKSSSQPTCEFTLENGLKIVVREDHRAPVVTSTICYKVGSSYETPGKTGLSHALERMMSKGSGKVGPGEASLVLHSLGAAENAYTTEDFTFYESLLSRDHLAVALELEADRMASARLPADEFAREIEVIKDELRLASAQDPFLKAEDLFKSLVYPNGGYHIPVKGWMEDLDSMTIEDIRHWHQCWYAPNNATLVVVGDVTPDEVKALAQRYFGAIPRRDVPTAKIPQELIAPGERQFSLHVQSDLPRLMLGFNVPGLATAENERLANALRLIQALLNDGKSSRLSTQLLRGEELLQGGSAEYNAVTRGDCVFYLQATPNTEKNITLAQAEAGLWKLLDQLKSTTPAASELERVCTQMIARLVFECDSIGRQAEVIGRLESTGLSWKHLDAELVALRSVTPEDIQRAARTCFTRQRLTTLHALPMPEETAAKTAHQSKPETVTRNTPVLPTSDAHINAIANTKLQSLLELVGKAPRHPSLNVQTWKTSEGAKVLFLPVPDLPMFDLRLDFDAGSGRDGDAPGTARMTNDLLQEGVTDRNAGQIAEVFDNLGAVFSHDLSSDVATVCLRSLSAKNKREPALALFAKVVGQPTFPDDSIARTKAKALVKLETREKTNGSRLSRELKKALYGDHPYAQPTSGTAQGLSAITGAKLKAFHEKTYAAGNVTIVLVGDLSRNEAEAIAAQVSAALPKGPALAKLEQPVEHQPRTAHLEFSTEQTALRLEQLCIGCNHPDYIALNIGRRILGNKGDYNRLMAELCDKRGLTNSVESKLYAIQAHGWFEIRLKTRAEISAATLKFVQDMFNDYLETGPTEKELQYAKRVLAGQALLSVESNASVVAQLSDIGFYNRPLAFLEDFAKKSQSLTAEQIKIALNEHLNLGKMVIMSAGPTVPQKPLPALA